MANYGEYVGAQKPAPMQTTRQIPPTVQHSASNSTLSANMALPSSQVVALVRGAMQVALEDEQTKTADANGMELRTGITIDLSYKNINTFPDEVVDIIKEELERLALSHNQITTFPARFAECTSLRYLNVRSNNIQDFPLAICELNSLEILDLGRNKLRVLPPELSKLSSLKVLSIQKNKLEALPLCIADMSTLQMIKLDGNPLQFPPPEVLQAQTSSSPPNGGMQDRENEDISITSQIKRFMRQRTLTERSEAESGGEESSEGAETPRPMKRTMSTRFPVKVSGTDLPDLRSPALQRAPPPIPSRSHYRGLSQQSTGARRPGVLPLTIGSANERLRSNSEGLLAITRERSADRSRRMGIVSKKSELTPVDETKSNRLSHYRGLSHGSAMNGVTYSPASPADHNQRATYVRRLSSLPERKRESIAKDPVIEAAQGILFALYQIHPQIEGLLKLARDPTNKRTSLERVFYNTSTHVEELDRYIQAYASQSDEEEETPPPSSENVRQACISCVDAYIHICKLLPMSVRALLENGDPRYIRSLLLVIYGSCAEIRNASAGLFEPSRPSLAKVTEAVEYDEPSQKTSIFRPRDKSITPTRDRPGAIPRTRSATVVQNAANLRVATDMPPPPFMRGAGRSATFTSATPRSGESFSSSATTLRNGEPNEEDRLFETIFLRLQETSDMSITTLPIVSELFIGAMKKSMDHPTANQPRHFWQILVQRTDTALQATQALKARMSSIRLGEPGVRTQAQFWVLCESFIRTYTDLVVKVKEAKSASYHFPPTCIQHLRPLQRAIKDCSQLITSSPWAHLTTPQQAQTLLNSNYALQGSATQQNLPMTPQSAALGPAAQATVPSAPQNVPFNGMFSRNVFERADSYLSMNSATTMSSRAGTMTNNLSSLSINDSAVTANSITSPFMMDNNKFSNNSKLAF